MKRTILTSFPSPSARRHRPRGHRRLRALDFDRAAARGHRLDIAGGTAVRFEPGQTRAVTLVPYGGDRAVWGFNKAVMGKLEMVQVFNAKD